MQAAVVEQQLAGVILVRSRISVVEPVVVKVVVSVVETIVVTLVLSVAEINVVENEK